MFREQALPLAQVITPNRFELAALTNLPTSSLEEILIAADTLLDAGPSTVVVTSVPSLRPSQGAGHDDRIAMVAVQRDGAWQVSTPRLPGCIQISRRRSRCRRPGR
ncbi:PfkB family carbohydrate kinase [Propionibacterium freudenreichii]|uniref:PfkB family carbohydrate kinase n=1 Tax=Propionibacterium freudenreichii TaxID=1744 RepID=UPI0009BC3701|nr:PfkB family carbohydrate kinase [Propionibacterium freudenreichii]